MDLVYPVEEQIKNMKQKEDKDINIWCALYLFWRLYAA